MVKAVIFDFDGVISDSEPLHYEAFNVILDPMEIEIPVDIYYEKFLGFTDQEAYEAISEYYGLELTQEMIDQLIEKKAVVFEELVRRKSSIIDGVCEFLEMLKANNIPAAICSGALKADIEAVFDAEIANCGRELGDYFSFMITADDVAKGKPDPEGYNLAIERLNEQVGAVTGAECVVIEDSVWGIQAAKAAGIPVIAVTNSYEDEDLGTLANGVVSNLSQIDMAMLNSICG